MIHTQPHKQTDPMKKPGQIKNDITLADYIQRKTEDRTFPGKKKLTFKEWTDNPMNWSWNSAIQYEDLLALWHGAQENV